MSAPGHCEHCADPVCRNTYFITELHASETYPIHWRDGECPRCDERAAIAEKLRARAWHYRQTESVYVNTKTQTPSIREGREFFKGAAEAIEWTLTDISDDSFSWITGEADE